MNKSFINNILVTSGSILEWYDFALFALISPHISQIFFPKIWSHNNRFALLLTYAIFASGYLARPLGSIVFGLYGDKKGRFLAIKKIMILFSIVAFFLSILPGYSSIGEFSPIILFLLRVAQGVILGGSFTGCIVCLYESYDRLNYFLTSIASCTGTLGIILASISASIMNFYLKTSLDGNIWRLGFLIPSIISLIICLIIKQDEKQSLIQKKANSNNLLLKSILNNKSIILICSFLSALHAASFYFVFVFLPVYFSGYIGIPSISSLSKNVYLLTFHMILIPIFGIFVQHFGGLRSLLLNSLVFAVIIIPLYRFLLNGGSFTITFVFLILSTITALNAAIIPGLISEIFSKNIRYTCVSISFNIAFGFFGGTIPFICTFLAHNIRVSIAPAIYLFLISLCTILASLYMQKRKYCDQL